MATAHPLMMKALASPRRNHATILAKPTDSSDVVVVDCSFAAGVVVGEPVDVEAVATSAVLVEAEVVDVVVVEFVESPGGAAGEEVAVS